MIYSKIQIENYKITHNLRKIIRLKIQNDKIKIIKKKDLLKNSNKKYQSR